MITVHHLNNSRSQRVLWLLEELGAPYEIVHHQRDAATQLAPSALLAIHPLGKSPVIVDGGRTVFESGAIVEYLCERHGGDSLVPARGTDAHIRHLELIHFAEGSAMTPILMLLYASRLGEAAAPVMPRIAQQLDSHFDFMEQQIGDSGWFIGDQLSAADIMLSFPAEVAVTQGRVANRPRLKRFVETIHARPAYQAALKKGGPYAFA